MSAASEKEIILPADDLIITKTDGRGQITYANRTFMRITGFGEKSVLGKPHNIIRHPDMPRGVFRLMWKTLASQREFFGFVKNYTVDGGFYWVFANVTPDMGADGKLKGYFSVRRSAPRAAVETISRLYAGMREVEARHGKAEAPDSSCQWLQDELSRQGAESYEQFVIELNRRQPASTLALS